MSRKKGTKNNKKKESTGEQQLPEEAKNTEIPEVAAPVVAAASVVSAPSVVPAAPAIPLAPVVPAAPVLSAAPVLPAPPVLEELAKQQYAILMNSLTNPLLNAPLPPAAFNAPFAPSTGIFPQFPVGMMLMNAPAPNWNLLPPLIPAPVPLNNKGALTKKVEAAKKDTENVVPPAPVPNAVANNLKENKEYELTMEALLLGNVTAPTLVTNPLPPSAFKAPSTSAVTQPVKPISPLYDWSLLSSMIPEIPPVVPQVSPLSLIPKEPLPPVVDPVLPESSTLALYNQLMTMLSQPASQTPPEDNPITVKMVNGKPEAYIRLPVKVPKASPAVDAEKPSAEEPTTSENPTNAGEQASRRPKPKPREKFEYIPSGVRNPETVAELKAKAYGSDEPRVKCTAVLRPSSYYLVTKQRVSFKDTFPQSCARIFRGKLYLDINFSRFKETLEPGPVITQEQLTKVLKDWDLKIFTTWTSPKRFFNRVVPRNPRIEEPDLEELLEIYDGVTAVHPRAHMYPKDYPFAMVAYLEDQFWRKHVIDIGEKRLPPRPSDWDCQLSRSEPPTPEDFNFVMPPGPPPIHIPPEAYLLREIRRRRHELNPPTYEMMKGSCAADGRD